MIKKFDKPVLSLDPLSKGDLLKKSEEAFSFLFDELKVHSAIAEVNSEDEIELLLKGVEKIPSLIPFRKT
jgi:predicted aldo/keto reductase-like oxidoreductase